MVAETSLGFTAVAVDYDPFAGPEIAWLVPTTESQAEIWMACLLGGDDANRAYNESVSLRLTGALDPAAMDQAVQALIRRHEALRAAFSANGAQMCVFRQRPITLAYDDVSPRTEADKEQFVADYVRQDALHVFNLTEGPLLKAGLIKLADGVYHLTLTAHHIICDGWSVAVMLQDLSKLYSAYARNMFPDLPPAVLFSRFADEQFLFTKSADYQRLEQFWVEQYQASIPVVNLPTDGPRPALRTFASERLDY
ncbi:MAG: non-ribosomal peptide synthetase, partial [Bacteroidetes bacterium]|nr:non-ribosomal peptide synthetase [Fibrella sp.]